MSDQDDTTRDGHRIDAGEQRTGRRTDADACSLRPTQKGNRAEVLPDALGRSSKTARASSKPCTEKLWSKKQREKRPKSVQQHFVLSTRDPLLLRRPLPFIARKVAV